MPIEDKTLLQINSTVIAGILILLTISSLNAGVGTVPNFTKASTSNQTNTQPNLPSSSFYNPHYVTGYLLLPFALGSILSIMHATNEKWPVRILAGIYGASYASTLSGFMGLMGFALWLQYQ